MSKRTLSLDFNVDERGVSPVIGVILMVAITVILAAVIGAFVLNLGSNLGSTGPQSQLAASCDTSGNPNIITISHKGGDALTVDELKVSAPSNGVWESNPGTELSVGGSINIEQDGGTDWSGSTDVTIVHEPSQSILLDTTVQC